MATSGQVLHTISHTPLPPTHCCVGGQANAGPRCRALACAPVGLLGAVLVGGCLGQVEELHIAEHERATRLDKHGVGKPVEVDGVQDIAATTRRQTGSRSAAWLCGTTAEAVAALQQMRFVLHADNNFRCTCTRANTTCANGDMHAQAAGAAAAQHLPEVSVIVPTGAVACAMPPAAWNACRHCAGSSTTESVFAAAAQTWTRIRVRTQKGIQRQKRCCRRRSKAMPNIQ